MSSVEINLREVYREASGAFGERKLTLPGGETKILFIKPVTSGDLFDAGARNELTVRWNETGAVNTYLVKEDELDLPQDLASPTGEIQ